MSSYADTSFLVSLYTVDANSAVADALMRRAGLPILLTPLVETELVNTLYLRVYRRELRASQIHSAHALFQSDMAGGMFQPRPLSANVFDKARLLSRKQTPRLGTRALDVLHVASAIELELKHFATSGGAILTPPASRASSPLPAPIAAGARRSAAQSAA